MIKDTRKIPILIILILVLSATITYGYHEEGRDTDKKVYLVIINRASLADFMYLKNVKRLIEAGGLGLMNTRGAIGYDGPDGYLTINTANRAYGNYSTSLFFHFYGKDDYERIYKRRTGQDDQGLIGNIEINRLKELNASKGLDIDIGALGDSVHKMGLKTAVFGNSDTADYFVRTNCLIAMDSSGIIDYGNIGDITVEDLDYPFGLKTNYQKLLEQIAKIQSKASLLVIETGDLNRLYSYSQNLTDTMYNKHKKRILDDIDAFMGNFIDLVNQEDGRVIILSPNSSDERSQEKHKLTPVVLWGNGIKRGILTSATTKRKGIVANIDVAPTVSKFLTGPFEDFTGHSIDVLEEQKTVDYINQLNKEANTISKLRYPILSGYNVMVLLTLIATTLSLLLKINRGVIKKLTTLGLYVIFMFPLLLILLGLFNITRVENYILYLFLFLMGSIIIIHRIPEKHRIFFIAGLTYFTILGDLLTGSTLTQSSTLGYDPIIGARYYGIGNEMIGLLLPTMFLFLSLAIDRLGYRYIAYLWIILTVFMIAHPSYGANFGGTLSILVAGLYYIFKTMRWHLSYKKVAVILLSIVIVILLMGFMDSIMNPTPTHIGLAFRKVIKEGPAGIFSIMIRKLMMNIKLIGVTIWAKVLFVSVICTSLLIVKGRTYFQRISHSYIFVAWMSSILGSTIGFFINDSGVLLAGMTHIFILSSLLYVKIGYNLD